MSFHPFIAPSRLTVSACLDAVRAMCEARTIAIVAIATSIALGPASSTDAPPAGCAPRAAYRRTLDLRRDARGRGSCGIGRLRHPRAHVRASAATTATVTVTVTVAGALTVEALYTFALALVVLNSAVAVKTLGNSFYGLAIGFTIVVAAFAGGPISGGAFNPAVGLDPIVVNAVLGGGTVANLWIYLVGPLVGGALAAGVFGVQEQEPISMHSKASQTPEQTPV
jgi:hypothetical protein